MTKICSSCGLEKDLVDFYKRIGGKYGKRADCKSCCKSRGFNYYNTNKETILSENKEKFKDPILLEKRKQQKRDRYKMLKHLPHIKEQFKKAKEKWLKQNKNTAKFKAHRFITQIRNKKLGYKNKEATKKHLIKLYEENTCAYCGIKPKGTITIDHIVPRVNPLSSNDPSNLQPLCRRCNVIKG